MATDPSIERREGALTANRLRELAETPVRGSFDVEHLKALHAYIFQDLLHHRPGEMRADTSGWSKFRVLEGSGNGHEVHYAHDSIERRAGNILRDLGGPAALSALQPDAFASRMAKLYDDLDHVHSFREGNSRTLREFTRSLAQASGYNLDWTPTSVDAADRNRLYVARDIAVLERAFPGLTAQRGMETNDRAEFEASLTLPALRRVPGASLKSIIRAGLTPAPDVASGVVLASASTASLPQATRPLGIAEMALAALARHQEATALPSAAAQYTPIADRTRVAKPATEPSQPSSQQSVKPTRTPDTEVFYRPSRGPTP